MSNTSDTTATPQLRRVLTAFDLMMMGVGCIIGVGIYILSGVAAANYAGPAIIISFIIAALLCSLVGLCYSELATIFPMAGSAYSYSYYSFGRATGWAIGWILILEYMVAASAVASGWSSYCQKFLNKTLNIQLPEQLTHVPGSLESGEFSINALAFIIMAFIGWLVIVGMKKSANFNNIIAVFKTLVLVFFVGFCIWFIDTNNWFPFIPERIATIKEHLSGPWELTLIEFFQGLFSPEGLNAYLSEHSQFWHYGIQGIMTGAAIVFFTYVGFDMVSSMSEEAKNPQRDMPIGIIGSLVLVTGLYIIVTLVLVGIMPPVVDGLPNPALTGHDAAAPLSIAIESITDKTWPAVILSIGALAGVTTTLLTLTLALSRIVLSISRDGFLPGFLSKIHPKFHTPHVAGILICTIVACIASTLPVGKLAELCNLGTLAAFIIVCLSIIVLRYTEKGKDLPRSFKCPWVPVLPIIAIIFCIVLMISLPVLTWTWFGIWLLLGSIVYITYGRQRVQKYPQYNVKLLAVEK